MDLGPHAAFIVTAYAAAALVVVALIAWVLLDHRAQTAHSRRSRNARRDAALGSRGQESDMSTAADTIRRKVRRGGAG